MTKPIVFNYKEYEELRDSYKELLEENQSLRKELAIIKAMHKAAESDEKIRRKTGKIRVYIAGPITGTDDYEMRFNRAEAVLNALGYEAVNPIADGQVEGADYRYYIDRGLKKLMFCNMVCVLDGWTRSNGAYLEGLYAKTCGIPYKPLEKFIFPKKD